MKLRVCSTLLLLLNSCFFLLSAFAAPTTKVPVTLKSGSEHTATCELENRRRWILRDRKTKSSRGGGPSSSASIRACRSLIPPKSVSGFDDLPSLSNIVVANLKGLSSRSNRRSTRAVSGTPPLLRLFPSLDIKDLFWGEGVVSRIADRVATVEDCNEFYGSSLAGGSAGLAGCFLAQETARSLENLLQSAVSLCYLRSIPELGVGDGVTILQGAENLIGGDFRKLFDAPAGSGRNLVEMRITGSDFAEEGIQASANEIQERIFVRPFNKATSRTDKNQYGYEIFFCGGSENTLSDYENTTIGLDGKIEIMSAGESDGFLFESSVTGYLTKAAVGNSKQISFNPQLRRTAEIVVINDAFGTLEKARIEFSRQNLITTKNYYSDNENGRRRGYSVLEFSGSEISETRFLQGAYKDLKEDSPGDNFLTSIEFQDDRYVSAPESSLLDDLNSVNLSGDEFYSDPVVNFSSSLFNCNTTGDVIVLLDFSDSRLQQVSDLCEINSLRNMNFCFDDTKIRQADQVFQDVCSPSSESN